MVLGSIAAPIERWQKNAWLQSYHVERRREVVAYRPFY